jgi:hypothetical protein
MKYRKPKPKLLEVADTNQSKGKKECVISTKVYNVHETIYSDQTGKFLKCSLSSNKYIMIMVDIDGSGIPVEATTSIPNNDGAPETCQHRIKKACDRQ